MNFDSNTVVSILDNLYDGLYITSLDRQITFWNSAAERITGFSATEVIGRRCAENILNHIDKHGTRLCESLCPLAYTMIDGQAQEQDVYLHHKDGHRLPVSVRTTPLRDQQGQIIGGIELFTDLSNRQATELRMKELQDLALLDQLTQIANRVYLERELKSRLEEKRRMKIPFGVIFIDIDHFKQINDSFGHDIGDEAIKLVARNLAANARPFDIFGRWGGDEFLGIIRNVTFPNLERLAERLRVLIEESFLDKINPPLQVTVSVGATLANEEENIPQMLKRADALLYHSKHNGRNRVNVAQIFPNARQ